MSLQLPRLLASAMMVGVVLVAGRPASADPAVAVGTQVQWMGKLAAYDRQMKARAKGTVRVLIVHKKDDAESLRIAQTADRAIKGLADVGGLPKESRVAPFVSAAALVEACKAQKASIVYLSVGLENKRSRSALR